MIKKEDIVTKNIVLNPVFYNAAKKVLDQYVCLHPVKRRREFDNNYWSLINILQHELYKTKEKPNGIEKYSKYGATIKLDNLHKVSGMRKGDVFLPLMKFFEEKGLVVPVRNENGNKSYSSGSDQYNSRSTVYYIPLQLVLEMEKYEADHGIFGECIEIEVSKKNIFYNKEIKKIDTVQIIRPEILDEMNSPYKDFRKWPTDWEQIDIIRISDIDYDENKFMQIARENNIQNPVELLQRCKGSAMKTKLSHGRVLRYGWNRLSKCLRAAVKYHGEEVAEGGDYHNADFRMLVVLAWMKRDLYNIDKQQIDQFEADVKAGIYKLMDQWTEYKYGVDRVKELMLTFKNATNDSKRWFTQFKLSDVEAMREIKQRLIQHYPTITNMLLNYREIATDKGVKNCLSVHCQHIEGHLMHQYVLSALEDKFVDPFTMCDAVWIRKSLATAKNIDLIERVLEEQYDNLIEKAKLGLFKLKEIEN